MQLYIDARMLSSGGIGTVLKNLIPPLSRPPFQTTLLAIDAPIYSIREQFAFPKAIAPCDLFWSPHYNVPLFPIRAKKRIVTIHDVCHLALSDLFGWKERLYARAMLRQAVRKSDLILTVSYFSQRELCKMLSISTHRIRVIYPGIDFEHFARKREPEEIRKKYNLPSAFYLFVGNVKPHKNLRLILEAYRTFSIDTPLVVVGRVKGLLNPDRNIAHKKVVLLEEVSDEELPAFYQMATALLFPSLYEGFGFPPLEAMAAGCPAVVSNRASIPEVCGNAACFIDPTSAEELARAMEKVASDTELRDRLKQQGEEQARKFSWEQTAQEHAKIFQEIL